MAGRIGELGGELSGELGMELRGEERSEAASKYMSSWERAGVSCCSGRRIAELDIMFQVFAFVLRIFKVSVNKDGDLKTPSLQLVRDRTSFAVSSRE